MPAKVNTVTGRYPSGPPPPYAYVPVDPFKPSLAFSLNNVFRQSAHQEVEAGRPSLHDPPQNVRREAFGFEGPNSKQRRRKTHVPSQPLDLLYRPVSPNGRPVQAIRTSSPLSPTSQDERRIHDVGQSGEGPWLRSVESLQSSHLHPSSHLPKPESSGPESGGWMVNERQTLFEQAQSTRPSTTFYLPDKRIRILVEESTLSDEGREQGEDEERKSRTSATGLFVPADDVPEALTQAWKDTRPTEPQTPIIVGESPHSLPTPQPPRHTPDLGVSRRFFPPSSVLTGLPPEDPPMGLYGSHSLATTPNRVEAFPLAVCRRCRILKMKCEYPNGSKAKCKGCTDGHHECVILPRIPRRPSSDSRHARGSPDPIPDSSGYFSRTTATIVAGSYRMPPIKSDERSNVVERFSESDSSVFQDTFRKILPKPSFSDRQSPEPEDIEEADLRSANADTAAPDPSMMTKRPRTSLNLYTDIPPPLQDRPQPVLITQPMKPAWRTVSPRSKRTLESTAPLSWHQLDSERQRSRSPSPVLSPPVSPIPSQSHYSPIAPPSSPRHTYGLSRRALTQARVQMAVTTSSSPFKSDSFENLTTESKPLASTQAYILAFFLDTVPRQIYLHMLLRLPSLYFSRVTRIFEEAEMSMPMIKQGILDSARAKAELGYDAGMVGDKIRDNKAFMSHPHLPMEYWEPQLENAAYANLQNTWQGFVDSLQKEWKTLNIISVLLLTAILTILQIPSAAADPLTRYSALLSMICALMSLLYGCIYIIRFGMMRKTYKGAEWAEEAQRSRMGIFWNVWVLLAMPATWLAWSMIMYIVTIMSFVWRTTPVFQPNIVNESSAQILIPRIIISLVVALGFFYFFLIAATLRRYGDMMDRAWQMRIWGWMRDGIFGDAENDDEDDEVELSYDEKSADGEVVHSWSQNRDNEQSPVKDLTELGSEKQERGRGFDRVKSTVMTNTVDVAACQPLSTFIAIPGSKTGPVTFPDNHKAEDSGDILPEQRETPNGIDEIGDTDHEIRKPKVGTRAEQVESFLVGPSLRGEARSPSNVDLVEESRAEPLRTSMEINASVRVEYIRLFGLAHTEISTDSVTGQKKLGRVDLTKEDWDVFKEEALVAMSMLGSNDTAATDYSSIASTLDKFNSKVQSRHFSGEAFLCQEFTESEITYAIYCILGFEPSGLSPGDKVVKVFSEKKPQYIPYGVKRLDIMVLDPTQRTGSQVHPISWASLW